jgi:glycine/sarcosine N-methyltransferase
MDFYTSIARYYDDIFPLEESQIQFIRNMKSDEKGMFVDIGCATGNLAIAVSQQEKSVLGIDYDDELIHIAQNKKGQIPNITFLQDDMRNVKKITYAGSASTICCLGNTLVHLNDSDDINAFIYDVYDVLMSGGTFIMQIINYDNVLENNIQELKPIDNDVLQFFRYYSYEEQSNLLSFKTKLVPKNSENQKIENEVLLYPLLHDELERMLNDNGFKNIQYFGSYDMQPYTKDSFLLIAVAMK